MTKLVNILLALCLCSTAASARGDRHLSVVKVTDFELTQRPDSVEVDFDLQIGEKAVRSRSNLTIIPVIRKGGMAVELTPVVVRGKRARILFARRKTASPGTMDEFATGDAIMSANGQKLHYGVTVPFREWMAGSSLELDGVDESCCSAERTRLGVIGGGDLIVPQAELYARHEVMIPASRSEGTAGDRQAARPESTAGERQAELFAFVAPASRFTLPLVREKAAAVYFRHDRTVLDRSCRGNDRTLADILSVLREIEKSTDSRVEKIVIVGYSSPEGSAEVNERISAGRARAVRDFIIANSTVAASRIEIIAGGEDWDGLRMLVDRSDIQFKADVLKVFGLPVWDPVALRGRETELKKLHGGRPYRYILENSFSDLLSAAYVNIYYSNSGR